MRARMREPNSTVYILYMCVVYVVSFNEKKKSPIRIVAMCVVDVGLKLCMNVCVHACARVCCSYNTAIRKQMYRMYGIFYFSYI